jgi:hypothetical protein
MVFEVVRGYIQLASGLSEVTRARATEVAQGLLSLPAVGVASGGQMAVQVGALAEELLAAAATNRQNLAALVRSEVDAAVNRLGLVSAEKLGESQSEVARLRAEVAQLRSASSKATARTTAPKRTAPKRTAPKRTAATKTAAKVSARKATAAKAPARKATAAKAPARKATAAKATARKATAAKATAKKATATKATIASRSAVITPGSAGA